MELPRPPRLYLATKNAGKVREFGRLLNAWFAVVPLPPHVTLPPETGSTFSENALFKAGAAFAAVGGHAAVLADDSGLEVDALGGEPGVMSARYAGEGAGDRENVLRLLAELSGRSDRRGRFVCALVLVLPPDLAQLAGTGLLEARGMLEGAITLEPRGESGFGYDPVFQPTGWPRTLAEGGPREKDAVSHRGEAVRALTALLQESGPAPDGGPLWGDHPVVRRPAGDLPLADGDS